MNGNAITIDARSYRNGTDPEVDITLIQNPLDLTGYSGTTGIALIDRGSNANPINPPVYTATAVKPIVEDLMTDFRVDTTNLKLQKRVRPISIMPRDDESDWIDIHQGVDCDPPE